MYVRTDTDNIRAPGEKQITSFLIIKSTNFIIKSNVSYMSFTVQKSVKELWWDCALNVVSAYNKIGLDYFMDYLIIMKHAIFYYISHYSTYSTK